MSQYAVIHVSKGKGASAGLTAHNEREKNPKNADPALSDLNRIEDYKHLGKTLEDRARKVIEQAGVQRKIQKDAVLYCPILLSGSHESMNRIMEQGQLDEWINDNKKFIENKFGAENVISFAMHADETTPHIHCSVVPIVNNGRKKAGVRLSAKDKFSPGELKKLQSEYAEAMSKWGLDRGMDSSETRAKHQDTKQWYRDLPQKIAELGQKLNDLERDVKVTEHKKGMLKQELSMYFEYEKEFNQIKSEHLAKYGLDGIVEKSEMFKNKAAALARENAKLYTEINELSELKKYKEMYSQYTDINHIRNDFAKKVYKSINVYYDKNPMLDNGHRFFSNEDGTARIIPKNEYDRIIAKEKEDKLKAEQEAAKPEQKKGIQATSVEKLREGSNKRNQDYHM